MPPKKSNKEAKALEKKKLKLVEDSTFGMKNKNKSKQLQKKIEQMKNQVVYGNRSNAEKAREERLRAEAKKEKEKQEALNKLLRASVLTQKVKPGVDPKTIVCEFFKQGLCKKGNKCKFSHDLSIERRAPKKSLYADDQEEKKKQTMQDWDQATLEKVVEQKHGAKNRGLPPTTIVCKYFLDAVEKGLYGWFWQCPNGEKCHYRHCLPPGFVLKKKGEDEKKDDEDRPSLEEVLENERKLLVGGTPVTLETFMEWKKKKIAEKEEQAKKEKKEKEAKAADSKGRMNVGMSGRDLFAYNPEMFEDDADADTAIDYTHREEEAEEEEEAEPVPTSSQEGAEDEEEELDEEELKKRYTISTTDTGPIDSSLFNADELDGLDDDDDDDDDADKKEEKGEEKTTEKTEETKEEEKIQEEKEEEKKEEETKEEEKKEEQATE